MKKITSLPQPDEKGNYWFRSYAGELAPAILISLVDDSKHLGRKRYFLSLGTHGIVFEQGEIKRYDSPQDALKALLQFYQKVR